MKNPKFRRHLVARIPLGRIANPTDIVGAALFFAAPASDFVTGQILCVDGGITASNDRRWSGLAVSGGLSFRKAEL
jgi:gluconate 5-dehydrogenase